MAATRAAAGSAQDKSAFPGTPGKKKKHRTAPGDAAPPGPASPSGFPVLATRFDRSPWNPVKAMRRAGRAENPEEHFREICAARKAGDPADPASWALPYRARRGALPSADGVRAALAALPHETGLTNRDQARAFLEDLARKLAPEWDEDIVDPGLLSAALLLGLEGAEHR